MVSSMKWAVHTALALLFMASCRPSTSSSSVCPRPTASPPDAGFSWSCTTKGQIPYRGTPWNTATRVPQPPGPDVRVLSAEVFFDEWPFAPPHGGAVEPEQLSQSSYKVRCRVDDSAALQRMWERYKAVRASAPPGDSATCPAWDAHIMVVFSSSDSERRWVAAGRPCGYGSRTLMVTEDYQRHERNGGLLRELAEVVGAVGDMQLPEPTIWQDEPPHGPKPKAPNPWNLPSEH